MTRWEYYVATHKLAQGNGWAWNDPAYQGDMLIEVLEKLGQAGWELVATTTESYPADEVSSGATTQIDYIFKRQAAERVD